MPFYVYVLRSAFLGQMYVGQTANLERRLDQHRKGERFWTRRAKDWELIYSESYRTRGAAMIRERYLKTGKGKEELRRLLIARPP
ncbi:MAG: GIY-YIG nuclease family protein [Acidobacteriia bacterium]|nr:GIY-YIG nuclease family protein [Terriglobia bacterium]